MPTTIRILHVLHAFSAGGIENGIVNIINRSPEHMVHELCLLSQSGEFVERLNRPVVVHELHKGTGNSLRIIFELRKLFQKRDYGVVHTRNWAAFDGVLAACLTPRTTLVHGEHGRDISDPDGKVYRRNLARRLLAFRAKKFIAVSGDLYRWLKQTVHIPAHKLEFIPNGVDTERFSPGRDIDLRRQLGINEHEFVVGTIGRLDPVKNHDGIIRAVQILHDAGYPVRLVIVGDGPLRVQIERSIRRSLLIPEPLLLGYRPDVERLYRLFDAFVLNSFAEGMSNTLLEAMASGLPIVCSAVGGNVEVIADGKTGIHVASGDDRSFAEAIRHYLACSAVRVDIAANARRYAVENCSIHKMIDRYAALYESVA